MAGQTVGISSSSGLTYPWPPPPPRFPFMSRRCRRRSKRRCEVEELNRISTSMRPSLLELWEYSVRSGSPNSTITVERNLTFSRSRRTTFLSHSTIFSSLTSQPFSSSLWFSFAFRQLLVCNVQCACAILLLWIFFIRFTTLQ